MLLFATKNRFKMVSYFQRFVSLYRCTLPRSVELPTDDSHQGRLDHPAMRGPSPADRDPLRCGPRSSPRQHRCQRYLCLAPCCPCLVLRLLCTNTSMFAVGRLHSLAVVILSSHRRQPAQCEAEILQFGFYTNSLISPPFALSASSILDARIDAR